MGLDCDPRGRPYTIFRDAIRPRAREALGSPVLVDYSAAAAALFSRDGQMSVLTCRGVGKSVQRVGFVILYWVGNGRPRTLADIRYDQLADWPLGDGPFWFDWNK